MTASAGKIVLGNLTYFLLLWLGQVTSREASIGNLYRPEAGFLLALVLLVPRRWWVFTFTNCLALDLLARTVWSHHTVGANALLALSGALVTQQWVGPFPRWDSLRDTLRVSLAGMALGSTLGATLAIMVCDPQTPETVLLGWKTWWLASALGVATLTPLTLWYSVGGSLREGSEVKKEERWVTLILFLVLVDQAFSRPGFLVLPFLLYPPLLWIAGRLGLLATGLASTAATILILVDTALGLGPFAHLDVPARSDSAAQMFILALSVSATVVATSLSDRARSLRKKAQTIGLLKQAEDRFESLFVHAAVAILLLSRERIQRSNQAAQELFGRSAEELLVPLESLTDQEADNREFDRFWPHEIVDGAVVPWRVRDSDGRRLELELYFSKTKLLDGPSFQIVLRDKTKLVALTELLVQERAELEHQVSLATAELEKTTHEVALANEQRERFLATVSHELRTPLAAIMGRSETLQEGLWGELTEAQKRSLERVTESGDFLNELVLDLLEMVKIQPKMTPLELAPWWIQDTVRSVIRLVTEKARQKRLGLSVSALPSSEVRLDSRFCKQILINLLTNAIKFTPEYGTVKLHCRLVRRELQFEVSDNGPGIPSHLREQLFQPFARADASQPGYGLGLVLVQKLVTTMGGTVGYETSSGGTNFKVNLPVSVDPGEAAEELARPFVIFEESLNLEGLFDLLLAHRIPVTRTHQLDSFIKLANENPEAALIFVGQPSNRTLELIKTVSPPHIFLAVVPNPEQVDQSLLPPGERVLLLSIEQPLSLIEEICLPFLTRT